MNKPLLFSGLVIFCLLFALLSIFYSGKEESSPLDFLEEEMTIREPAAAGKFYPLNKEELKEKVEKLLKKAEVSNNQADLFGLIVPHAGYDFSGLTAAYGFKSINSEIDTVVIMANSHQEFFEGISVFKEGYYRTPLGKVEIDSELAGKLIESNEKISFRKSAHQNDHVIEVEIPFLQFLLDDFKIVPVLFGNSGGNDYRILAEVLKNLIAEKKVLIIASSDLSHYPSRKDAEKVDSQTIEAILTGKVNKLEERMENLEEVFNLETPACGIDAVKTLMLLAEGMDIKLLNYSNSGEVTGDETNVVGYASIGFFNNKKFQLSQEDKEKLLKIARHSVESYVKKGKIEYNQPDNLNEKLGAFVTIKKEGELRGCIGTFSPSEYPLHETVSRMAVSAASEDERFKPVTEEELKDLEYEISVLSELKRIENWKDIKLGEQGVKIVYGSYSGVFLPQVAKENNWNLEEFLSQLCFQKVGLSSECYKNNNVDLYVFEAEIFGE